MFLCGWEHASLGFSRQKDRRRDRKARCLVFMTRRESGMERRLVSLLTREGKEKRRRGCGEWNGWKPRVARSRMYRGLKEKKKKKKGIETDPLIYDRKERRHRARFRARREKREQNRVVAARCISYARAHWS